MNQPRGVEARISWMLSHPPGQSGMCARETWEALGGDQNPANPPAWGCPDANACYDKVIASGRYWTGDPPRGAAIYWKYSGHGHAALSYGDGKIVTTDPSGNPKGTGIESLSYPEKAFGASASKRIYTDQYNGVRFAIGADIDHGPIYLSKLVYGQQDSDSVRRLQLHLNAHPLDGGQQLPIVGNYGPDTDHEVRLCQQQHGYGGDPAGSSSVGPNQAKHLFTGCACTVTDDRPTQPVTPEPPVTANSDYWFSGKPAGTLTFSDSYKRLDVDKWSPPADGLVFGMLYANVDGEGEFRVRLIRDPDDATAYQTYYAKAGDNCLITHVWFEAGEKGRPLWWEFCSMDGTTHTVGTRYAKFTLL